jgi:hypothetical protein
MLHKKLKIVNRFGGALPMPNSPLRGELSVRKKRQRSVEYVVDDVDHFAAREIDQQQI